MSADPRPRLPSLTGLRFIAAAAVFGFHILPLVGRAEPLRPMLMAGQAGVSFFFVLSGFVLTWSHRVEDTAATFWRRRAARIVPSHLLTWLLATPVVFLSFGAWPTAAALVATAALVQAWIPDSAVFFGVNGVAWSLSCEALFYLLFPALVRWLRRLSSRGRLLGGAACLLTSASLQLGVWACVGGRITEAGDWPFWLVSVLPLARLPEFVLGMLAAAQLDSTTLPRLSLRVVAGSTLGVAYLAGTFPSVVVAGWLTAVPFVLLILAAAQADLDPARTPRPRLARTWLVCLGEWSFAFYLTHQLVIRVVEHYWHRSSSAGPLGAEITLAFLGALVSSAVLHRGVEVPAERRLGGRRAHLARVPNR